MKEIQSTKEQEITDWERLKEILGFFYVDIQKFRDVSSQKLYKIGDDQYSITHLGIQKTEFGFLSAFILSRFEESSLEPAFITIRLKPDFSEVVVISSGWRFYDRTDGVLYSFIGAKEGKVSRIVQAVRPNGYFNVGDLETDRKLTQVFRCELSYEENGLTMLNLQLRYEKSGKAQLSYIKEGKIDTKPIQVDGRKFSTPTIEQVIEALKKIRENQKALILKEIS